MQDPISSIICSIIGNFITDEIKSNKKIETNNISNQIISINFNGNDVIQKFFDEINKIIDSNEKIDFLNKQLFNNKELKKAICEKEYKTNFARKLDIVIDLFNENIEYGKKTTLATLCEYLGYPSVNNLKKYYINVEEPTFEEIKEIADKLGINSDWLSGKNETKEVFSRPFTGDDYDIWKFYEKRKHDNIDEYIFVFSDIKKEPYFMLIRKVDDYKFEVCNKVYVAYDSTGYSGECELCELHKFFIKMFDDEEKHSINNVSILDNKKFEDLQYGRIFPGSILKYRDTRLNYFIYDFINLKDERIESNKLSYGEVIYKAQVCVKRMTNGIGKDFGM